MRRLVRLCVLALLALGIAGVVRIVAAPVELPLAGLLERLAKERAGADLSVGHVAVGVGLSGVRIVVGDVGVRAPGVSATVGAVAVTVGLTRRVAVSGLVLRINPPGPRGPLAPPTPHAALRAFDQALDGVADAAAAAGLVEVSLQSGRVDVIGAGRPLGEVRVFQDIAATASFGKDVVLSATMVGAQGPIEARLTRTVEAGTARIEGSASGLVPADLGPAGAVQSGFVLSPRFTASVGAQVRGELALDISTGSVILGADPLRRLDTGRVELAVPADRDVVEVRRAEFVAGRSDVAMSGILSPGAASAEPWTFALDGAGSTLDSVDLGFAPVVLDEAHMRGRIDAANALLVVDELAARADGGQAAMAFTFDFGANGPRMSGAMHVRQSSVATLLGAWPAIFAHEPRQAVARSVKGGAVKRIDFDFALTREDLDGDPSTHNPNPGAISVEAEIVDATLGAPELPVALRRAAGAFRLRDRVMSVIVDEGVVAGDAGGELIVTDAAMTIPDLAARPPQASISATVDGPVAAVVGIADMLNLEDLESLRITPADVTGTVKAEVAMVTPLAPAVTMADRRWSIDATLNNASSTVPIGGQVFSDANVRIAANSRRLAARGRAKVGGISIDVNYTELFSGEKTGAARFVLTDKDRRDRGFDTGESVRGPVTVTLEQGGDGANSFEADFTEAEIVLPGFRKRAGQSLVAVGAIAGEPPDVEVSDLEVDGGGLSVTGSLSLGKAGLRRAELGRFALSEGDRARVSVGGAGEGFRVDIEATQFDARAVLKAARSSPKKGGGGKGKAGQPITLTARGTRVRVTDAAHISDLDLEASYDGRRIVRLSASGRLDGVNAGAFAARVVPEASGARRVQADVADLGRTLGAFDVYGRMRGGRLILDGQLGEDGVMKGRITVADFLLADERTLEDLIAVSRPASAEREEGARTIPGSDATEGLAFDRMAIEFEKRGDRIVLSDAIVRGPLLGGTASGEVDLAAGRVTLNGTIIPAYGVNNLFGRMPVVGTLLGAGKQGGLIGLTFRLEGPLSEPKLSWNPLSAVAPGIFRRIFEYR